MQFSFVQGLIGSLLVSTSAAAALDRRTDAVPAVALEDSDMSTQMMGRRLNFCKQIDFVDCFTFLADPNICCKSNCFLGCGLSLC